MFFLLEKKRILMGLKIFLYKNCSVTGICLPVVTILLTIVSFSSNSHRSCNKDYLFGHWCLEPLQKTEKDFNSCSNFTQDWKPFSLQCCPYVTLLFLGLNNPQGSRLVSYTLSIYSEQDCSSLAVLLFIFLLSYANVLPTSTYLCGQRKRLPHLLTQTFTSAFQTFHLELSLIALILRFFLFCFFL